MLVQFISHHYSNKLGNPGEKQVGTRRFLILGFTAGNTKTVFEVVDGFLNIYPDLVGGIPFLGAADGSQISAKVPLPFHFGTDKFHGWKITAQMGFTSFPLYGE